MNSVASRSTTSYRAGFGASFGSPLNVYCLQLPSGCRVHRFRNGYEFGAYRPSATRSCGNCENPCVTANTGIGWNWPMPNAASDPSSTTGYG
jgi:hypothetical protein